MPSEPHEGHQGQLTPDEIEVDASHPLTTTVPKEIMMLAYSPSPHSLSLQVQAVVPGGGPRGGKGKSWHGSMGGVFARCMPGALLLY